MPDSWNEYRKTVADPQYFNADMPRALTDEALVPNMNLIYMKIRAAASKGENSLYIYDSEICKHSRIAEKAVIELIANGFSAKFHAAVDQRDDNHIIINW